MLLKLFKKLVPKTNELKEVDSVVTWQVRWNSLKQNLSGCQYVVGRPEVAVFHKRITNQLWIHPAER